MTTDELAIAKRENRKVLTRFGAGYVNGIGNTHSYVRYPSDESDTLWLLRLHPNGDISEEQEKGRDNTYVIPTYT